MTKLHYTTTHCRDKNYLFPLPGLSVLSILGDKPFDFLQGQLTCDIREINEQTMRQGALCNLKGRVLALLDVLQCPDYQLVLPKNLVEDTKASLEKVALLSRVRLQTEASIQVFGFLLNNKQDLLPCNTPLLEEVYAVTRHAAFKAYAIGDNFYLILVNEEASELALPFQQNEQLASPSEWHALQLTRKQVTIYPETRGLFLPHRLELHKTGYISFDKGCYKGQEIIARMHFLGKPSHQLQVFKIHPRETLTLGMSIFEQGSRDIGDLVDFCPLEDGGILILTSILQEHPETVLFEGHQYPTTLKVLHS